MREFTLSIDLGNEAMETPDDVATVLESIADRCRTHSAVAPGHTQSIMDLNGNRVGSWKFHV